MWTWRAWWLCPCLVVPLMDRRNCPIVKENALATSVSIKYFEADKNAFSYLRLDACFPGLNPYHARGFSTRFAFLAVEIISASKISRLRRERHPKLAPWQLWAIPRRNHSIDFRFGLIWNSPIWKLSSEKPSTSSKQNANVSRLTLNNNYHLLKLLFEEIFVQCSKRLSEEIKSFIKSIDRKIHRLWVLKVNLVNRHSYCWSLGQLWSTDEELLLLHRR